MGSKKGEVFIVGESMDSDEGIATANIFLSQSSCVESQLKNNLICR